MDAKDLAKVNKELNTVSIKGKNYVMVKDRITAFREICPNGTIETEIISHADGQIVIKATVKDGETVLATGTAWERETSSYINKTSYVENCETSAVGRALGFAGIGVDESMATADEVANAMLNQSDNTKVSQDVVVSLKMACEKRKAPEKVLLDLFKVKALEDIKVADYQKMRTNITRILDENKGNAD